MTRSVGDNPRHRATTTASPAARPSPRISTQPSSNRSGLDRDVPPRPVVLDDLDRVAALEQRDERVDRHGEDVLVAVVTTAWTVTGAASSSGSVAAGSRSIVTGTVVGAAVLVDGRDAADLADRAVDERPVGQLHRDGLAGRRQVLAARREVEGHDPRGARRVEHGRARPDVASRASPHARRRGPRPGRNAMSEASSVPSRVRPIDFCQRLTARVVLLLPVAVDLHAPSARSPSP